MINKKARWGGRPMFIDTGEKWLDFYPTGAPPNAEREARRIQREQREADAQSWKDIWWSGGSCYKGAFKTMQMRHRTASRAAK